MARELVRCERLQAGLATSAAPPDPALSRDWIGAGSDFKNPTGESSGG
jgi:hypothetical protein